MKKFTAISVVVFLLNAKTTAQVGSWSYLSGKYSISEKWSAFGEAQLRSTTFYNRFHYFEYKAGLTYSIDKNVSFSGAAGHTKHQ